MFVGAARLRLLFCNGFFGDRELYPKDLGMGSVGISAEVRGSFAFGLRIYGWISSL